MSRYADRSRQDVGTARCGLQRSRTPLVVTISTRWVIPVVAFARKTHLYIRNFAPQRWPAGAPQKYDKAKFDDAGQIVSSTLGRPHGGYHDIDDGPTLQWMIANREQPEVRTLFSAAVDRRPREELFDIESDPCCLTNLAEEPSAKATKDELAGRLTEYLTQTGDLRQTDPQAAHVWETYPRVSSLRWFPVPDWAIDQPAQVPQQDWLEKRRPR